MQFEKVENKPVVIGYLSAAVVSVFFAEWLIHLPLLDVVSGPAPVCLTQPGLDGPPTPCVRVTCSLQASAGGASICFKGH